VRGLPGQRRPLRLFNRIILKILGYDGTYIDYSAKEWPERLLDEPLVGRQ
jgi:hypothetical protein